MADDDQMGRWITKCFEQGHVWPAAHNYYLCVAQRFPRFEAFGSHLGILKHSDAGALPRHPELVGPGAAGFCEM